MDYQPTNYINGAPPAINDVNLNHIETAVDQAFQAINSGPIKVDTIAGLKALSPSSFANNDTRTVLGYYAAGDGGGGLFRYNSTSSVADNGGTIIAPNTGSGRWERILEDGIYNVKHFGARGIGSGGATDDQTGFTSTLAAVGTTGMVYIPPGDYYVTGGFTQGISVIMHGAGHDASRIFHTGNNVCFTSVASGASFAKRGWRDFYLVGNAGASAKGIVAGHAYGMEFRSLMVQDYSNGTGIEVANSTAYTEGTTFDGVHVRDSLRCIAFTRSGLTGGADSFSDTRFQHCVVVCNITNAIGLYLGDNITMYGGTFALKLHVEVASGTGMRLGTNTNLFGNLYNVLTELWAGQAISAAATSIMVGGGIFESPGGTIAAGAQIFIGQRQNDLSQTLGGTVSNWRATGGAADIFPAIIHDPTAPVGGFALAEGSSIVSPVILVYDGNWNAFEVRTVPSGQKAAQGSVIFSVESASGHLATGGIAPGIAAGTGAGTSPTLTVGSGSNDTCGYLNITTGTGTPAASAIIATVTFGYPYKATPKVILTPANAAASTLTNNRPFVDQANVSTSAFQVRSTATGLAVSTAYQFWYQVIQ